MNGDPDSNNWHTVPGYFLGCLFRLFLSRIRYRYLFFTSCDSDYFFSLLQTLSEIDEPGWLSPDFIKACIRVVMCCIRLGEVAAGREAVQIIVQLGEIPAISALTQAGSAGAKQTVAKFSFR